MRLKNAIYDYEYMTSDALMAELCEQIETAPEFGFDLETTALQPWDGRIRLAQFSFGRKVYVVDFFKVNPDKIMEALSRYRGVMVGQFLKFEQKWLLWHHKVKFGKLFDTYRASNILLNGKTDFSGKPLKHTLYDIYARYNIIPKAQDYQAFDWATPELPVGALDYAAEDVIFMSELREKMKSDIIAANLTDTATVEMNVLLPEAAIELKGMHFNKELWLKTAEENKIKSESLQKELYTLLPNPSNQLQLFQNVATWNLDSNDQLLQSLKKLGIKQRKDITVLNERGFPQIIGEEIVPLENTMEMSLANAVYPNERTEKLVQKVIEYRGISQRLKTFGPEYLKFVNPHTGRLHTSFYGFTGAGRYSSKEPNLQQLPRDKEYRACFEAAPGKWWVAADYKNIEMVIAAEIANDTRLREIFASDDKYLGDAHYITGAAIMGCQPHEVTKEQRQRSKAPNFGFLYGMGAKKMVLYAKAGYGVTFTLEEAQKYRDAFFELYPGIAAWHQKVKNNMNGVCRTVGGRIRYMRPDDYSSFFNTPVQGCLQYKTRVLTNKGYLEIGKLYESNYADKQVWTGTQWASFDVLNRGPCELAEIILSDGTVLPCDTRHKLLKVTDSGYEWVSYSDISNETKVATSIVRSQVFDTPSELPDIKNSCKSTIKAHKPVDFKPEEFWYWIGYYYGDGWKDSVRGSLQYAFGATEVEKVNSCKEYWDSWGVKSRIRSRTHTPHTKESTRYTVEIDSVDLVRWLSEIGIEDATAHTKRLPLRIYQESISNRTAFIKGILDSDGYSPNPQQENPSLHLCNRDLLNDIKILLRTLGVESSLKGPYSYKGFDSYKLSIFNRMLQEAFGNTGIWTRMPSMPTPKFLLTHFIEKYGKTRRKSFSTNSSYVLFRRILSGGTVSIYTLDKLLTLMGWTLDLPIYAYRQVERKVSLGKVEDTYTLSVNNELHRFDSEGVISKNTGADGLKRALRLLYDRYEKELGGQAELVHDVHDEIISETATQDKELIAETRRIKKSSMEEAMRTYVKTIRVQADPADGKNWAETH